MTTQEAYKVLFEDFKSRVPVGSTVRLVRFWTDDEAKCWGASSPGTAPDDLVLGEEYIIEEYLGLHNTVFLEEVGYNIPITCLEVVSTKPTSVQVKLNYNYTAIVYKDKIQVGCQVFEPGILTRLVNAHNKVIG